jgi:molybdopterin converting factor small subunit
MLKKINLSTFLLTKGVDASYYSVSEINFLFENLSKYKFSGIVVISVEDFNEDYAVMVDEGLIVSVVFMGFEFEEISPIVLKNRYGEKNKITVYTMPSNYSDILRAFYRFENIIMNNVINNKKDMDNLLSILSKQNITGIINFTLKDQQYYILIKKGNPVLRNELINNGNLITSFYYYKEIIYEKILGNNKIVISVLGLEDKQLEKIIEENEKKHMVVKELEVKALKGWGIAPTIRLSKIIYEEWYKVFELPPKMIKIDGYNEKLGNVKVDFDEKIEPDSVFISESLIKRIKIRNKPIDKGDKIIIIPQFE